MNFIRRLLGMVSGEAKIFKHTFKEIIYAVIIVIFINAFLIQNYQIPTGSMIPTIMPGDRLFANRFVYGIKIPFTDGIKGYRLPSIKKPERGDLIVFRAPASAYFGCEGKEPYYTPSTLVQILKLPIFIFSMTPFNWDPRLLFADFIGEKLTGGKHIHISLFFGLKTIDLDPRKEYVKRVIATSGETVEINNKNIYIDGEIIEDNWGYFMHKDLPSSDFSNLIDFYGPIYVPKKGDTIIFRKFEDRHDYYNDLNSFEVIINDQAVHDDLKQWLWMNIYITNAKDSPNEFIYEVDEDYFFVLGDNRDDSCDSRMWGLVPYRAIKGQPMITWIQAKRPEDAEKQGFFEYFFIK